MGQKASNSGIGAGEALFTKTQRQLLALLFGSPFRRYYGNELIRLAGVGIGSARKVLHAFVASGIVIETKEGHQKYYQANKESPIFEELHGIAIKTFGVAEVMKKVLEPFEEQIQFAYIFGSVAKGTERVDSDIDILIVAKGLDYFECMKLLMPLRKELCREISPTLYEVEEFARKLAEQNHFLTQVEKQPKIMLIGTEDDLEKFRKDRGIEV